MKCTKYITLLMLSLFIGISNVYALNPRNLEVGDYVDYKPKSSVDKYTVPAAYSGKAADYDISAENLVWRVLKIYDNGTVDIVAETQTATSISLMGAIGYNNGVYLLNDIADKLYSNNDVGAVARSMSMEDLPLPENTDESFGKRVTINNSYYPFQNENDELEFEYDTNGNLLNKNDIFKIQSKSRGLIVSTGISNRLSGSMNITQTIYGDKLKIVDFNFPVYFEQLVRFTNQDYWLATRRTTKDDGSSFAKWGLYYGKYYEIRTSDLYQGWGTEGQYAIIDGTHYLKPIVNISIDKINTNDCTRTGFSADYAWKIEDKTDVCESYSSPVFELTKKMQLGINIGNSLDAMDKSWGKMLDTDDRMWSNAATTEDVIRTAKEMGFTSIRIPVSYYNHLDDDGVIDPLWFAKVKQVVDWAYKYDFYIIINVHHDAGMSERYRWIYSDVETYEEDLKNMKNLWSQIANYFKDYDDNLLFEFYNEIMDTTKSKTNAANMRILHDMSQELITLIRNTGGNNATRFLIVPTYGAQLDPIEIESLMYKPFVDTIKDHLILEIHGYRSDKDRIVRMFRIVNNYSRMYKMPFLIGEFGQTETEADQDTRVYVAGLFSKYASEIDVPIFWWDNGTNYRLFSRVTLNIDYADIVEALFSHFHRSQHGLTKVDKKDPTLTTDGNIEYYHCEVCNRYFTDPDGKNEIKYEDTIISKLGEYKILDKPEADYVIGVDENYSFRANGLITSFVKLIVDDVEVSSDNYELTSGSTIVTLKNTFLDLLSSGEHTLTFVFKDGSVSTIFAVEKANNGSEKNNNNEQSNSNSNQVPNDNNTDSETPSDDNSQGESNNDDDDVKPSDSNNENTDSPSKDDNKNDKTNKNTISPNTFDNIFNYFILLIISSVTVIVIRKKYIIKK